MSKNKNYTDYSKAYEAASEETSFVPTEEVVEETKVDDKTIVVKEVVKEKKYKLNNCTALNVRILPNDDIIEVVNKNDVLIDMGTSSDPEWVNVKTGSGLVGYVRKEFVSEI